MRQDLRDAFRGLRRAPTFTLVAVITLALAIGSTTAVFSVVDAVLIRGLPYAEVGRLQAIYERGEKGALRVPSYPTFRDWQTQSAEAGGVIEGMAFVRGDGVTIAGSDDRHIAAYVSPVNTAVKHTVVVTVASHFVAYNDHRGIGRINRYVSVCSSCSS